MDENALSKIDSIFSKYKGELESEQKGTAEADRLYFTFRANLEKIVEEFIRPILITLGERLKSYGANFDLKELPPETHDAVKKITGISIKITSMPINDYLELTFKATPSPVQQVIVALKIGQNPLREPKEYALNDITTTFVENCILELIEKSFDKRPTL